MLFNSLKISKVLNLRTVPNKDLILMKPNKRKRKLKNKKQLMKVSANLLKKS
jgi:hypothetical protein